jgi:hypothetical protein
MPARVWIPHAVNGPVNDVSTPILIEALWAVPLDPPKALDPLKAAVSATTPTAATNRNRFTEVLLPSSPP